MPNHNHRDRILSQTVEARKPAPGAFFAIRIVRRASGKPTLAAGGYVKDFDPDADGGRGKLTWAPSPMRAKRFDSWAEIIDYRDRTAAARSPQGLAREGYRPMLAFVMEIVEVKAGDGRAKARSQSTARAPASSPVEPARASAAAAAAA